MSRPGDEAVADTLAQLVAKSLLVMDAAVSPAAYRLLETTRAYAAERLRLSGEEQAVRRRHAEHLCGVLERAAGEWAYRPARDWGAAYAALLDDVRAALAWAGGAPEHRPLLIRLTAAAILVWNHVSLTDECRIAVADAVEALGPAGLAGTQVEMRLQLALAGATLFTRGPVPAAMRAVQRAHDIAVATSDTEARLRSLRMIASLENFAGRHAAAIRAHETFLAVAAIDDPSAVPECETHLGIAEIFVGRLWSARLRLEKLQERHLRELDDPRFARFLYDRNVDIGNVLSNAQWLTGSPETALRTAEATVEQGLATRHGLSLANALAVAACPLFYMSGLHDDAERYAVMLEDQVMRQGIVLWRPVARFYRAAVACTPRVPPPEALDALDRAIAGFREIEHRVRMPFYLGVRADALVRGGRLAAAGQAIRGALDCARHQGDGWSVPELLRIRAAGLAAEARPEEAEAVLLEALAQAEAIGALTWRLRVAHDLAASWRHRSQPAEARALLQRVLGAFTEGHDLPDLVAAHHLLAALGESGTGVP